MDDSIKRYYLDMIVSNDINGNGQPGPAAGRQDEFAETVRPQTHIGLQIPNEL